MLTQLYIRNFALIDELSVDFQNGFIAVTGETGTGKSIVLGALKLVLGERADYSQINSEEKCVIEAHFTLKKELKTFFEEHDLDFELQTIIRREILPQGKSRAFVNDVPTHLSVLQELSSQLIDIHSQFDTAELLQEKYQLKMLDYFAGNQVKRNEYHSLYKIFQQEKITLSKLLSEQEEAAKQSEYSLFLYEELRQLELETLDFSLLENELQEQEHAEEIAVLLHESLRILDDETLGLQENTRQLSTKLQKLQSFSHSYESISQRTESIVEELKDILNELQYASEKIDINPEQKAIVKQKVDAIHALFSKHSVKSIEELMHIQQELEQKTSGFSENVQLISQLEQSIAEKQLKLQEIAQELSEKRNQAAPKLSAKILETIHQLGLENATLLVSLNSNEDLQSFGFDTISFLFSANIGKEPQSIDKAISGGERSRVMLALKKVMAENEQLPTLIFDEIDTGVSGRIASEIGTVMQQMAKTMQLIVITHLPQVAAKANSHFKVEKQVVSNQTFTKMISLTHDERISEIAHLLSGEIVTEAAQNQAKELLKLH